MTTKPRGKTDETLAALQDWLNDQPGSVQYKCDADPPCLCMWHMSGVWIRRLQDIRAQLRGH